MLHFANGSVPLKPDSMSRALELASETQRKSEVLDGLSHWDSIPAGFAGKPKLILPPIFFGEPNQPVRRAVRQQSDNPNNSFP